MADLLGFSQHQQSLGLSENGPNKISYLLSVNFAGKNAVFMSNVRGNGKCTGSYIKIFYCILAL